MFGLIPMVITIILAGLITAAVAFIGGDIFSDSSLSAKANTFVNEGSQVRSASQIYRVTQGAWPTVVTDLTGATPSYLGSAPSYEGSPSSYAISSTNGTVTYTQAIAGTAGLTDDVCKKIQGNATDTTVTTLPTAEPTGQLYGCWLSGTTDNVFFHK